MIPIFAGTRLDWSSAIGLFIINFGILDYLVMEFLEGRIQSEQWAKVKGQHFKDRMVRVEALLSDGNCSTECKDRFAKFLIRFDPIRELRNHIAHGHLLIRVEEDVKSSAMTLSLPKNLDVIDSPDSRQVEFVELEKALGELTELIEEFKRVCELAPNTPSTDSQS